MKCSARLRAGLGLIALISVATPSIAHHSFAMFDRSRTLMLPGTVKEVQWANPHTWIQLLVSGEDGTNPAEWSIEAGSPNMMVRQGWSSHTLKAGDKISLQAHPMLDGRKIASLVSVTLADGRVLGSGGEPPPQSTGQP
jgi:hypothetical protein